ncbi:MAG: ferritin family protein [Candidatus Zixiibacteriota bacterium]|nr:MAG: ferritin family protein [candidate division Zixibacteria bacterium]
MDVIEFAMKMEQDGKAYYEKLAAQTTVPELKQVLLTLAEEEGRHYEYFRRLKEDNNNIPGDKAFTGRQSVEKIVNIFEQLAEDENSKRFEEEVISAWTKALRIEEKSVDFYESKAATETDSARKGLLQKIAEEEHNHVHMIDGVLMYLKHPAAFAESSHFKSFRSLEGWGYDDV